MAESSDANRDFSEASEHRGAERDNSSDKQSLPKQESLVLYTQAALSGGAMSGGSGRRGRKPRSPIVLHEISEARSSLGGGVGRRRAALVKQQSQLEPHSDDTGKKYLLTHQDTPNIVISADCDASDEDEGDDDDDDGDDGPRTPLPVLPIVLPEPDSEDEGRNDSDQLSAFLGITQRYRRSSLVRMDAVQQPTSNSTLEAPSGEPVRKLSVHGSLDLPKNTLKDLMGFRKAQSFSADDSEDEDDTIAISELNPSVQQNMFLTVPGEVVGKHKRKGSKKKRPSLRRFLTITSEPQMGREELEERRNCRKKEKEERRKERAERKLKEKQKQEEDKYDEDGVSMRHVVFVIHRVPQLIQVGCAKVFGFLPFLEVCVFHGTSGVLVGLSSTRFQTRVLRSSAG